MKEAGYKSIEVAKENGSWEILDEIEALVILKNLDVLRYYVIAPIQTNSKDRVSALLKTLSIVIMIMLCNVCIIKANINSVTTKNQSLSKFYYFSLLVISTI